MCKTNFPDMMINSSTLPDKYISNFQSPPKAVKVSSSIKGNNVVDLIYSENWEKLRRILKKPSVFRRFSSSKRSKIHSTTQDNLLHIACKFNPPIDIVKYLIKSTPLAPHEMDCKGRYPLHIACEYGCEFEIVQLLTTSNPDAAKKIDINCRSPYLLACKSYVKNSKWSSATKDLLKVLKKLDEIDTKMHALEDIDDMTPLEYAVEAELSMRIVTYIQQITEDRRNKVKQSNEILSNSERARLGIEEICKQKNYVLPKEYNVGIEISSMRIQPPINQSMEIAIETK